MEDWCKEQLDNVFDNVVSVVEGVAYVVEGEFFLYDQWCGNKEGYPDAADHSMCLNYQ
jgi:hypothetical protein